MEQRGLGVLERKGGISTYALARDNSTYLSVMIALAEAETGSADTHGMRLARMSDVVCRGGLGKSQGLVTAASVDLPLQHYPGSQVNPRKVT